MLVDSSRATAVELLRRTRLLEVLLPELTELASSSVGQSGVWEHTKHVMSLLPEPSFSAALAALLHGLDERGDKADVSDATGESLAARTAATIGERWRLSNKERDLAQWLLDNHGRLTGAASQPWSAVQPLLIEPGAAELVALHEAEGLAHGGEHAVTAKQDVDFCRQKLSLPPAELDPPPLIGGNDLFEHGVPKGAIYKLLLSAVRAAQLDGKARTRAEAFAIVDRLLEERP